MNEVWIYLNGEQIHYNAGDYLPFVVYITTPVNFSEENTGVVRLNIEDNFNGKKLRAFLITKKMVG